MSLNSDHKEKTYQYYVKAAGAFYQSTVNLDMAELYEPFLKLIPEGGKILDAGCGSGRDALYFKQNGYSVTAFDYSEELVKLASEHTGEMLLCLSFEDMEFEDEFNGIWCCASLLHISRKEMKDVFLGLTKALMNNGFLYASFKYGDSEEFRNGRFFSNWNEDEINQLVENIAGLKLYKYWETEDVRKNRKGEYWLNVLFQKVLM
jgi:SAM-dependent methyltransferase